MKFHRNPGLHNLETCFITMKISEFKHSLMTINEIPWKSWHEHV